MGYSQAILATATLMTGLVLAIPAACLARTEVIERPLKGDPTLLPAAASPDGLHAPVLSGIDYTTAAPPNVVLRIVEDEPYAYLAGLHCGRRLLQAGGFSAILLSSLRTDGGSYRARICLEWEPRDSEELLLLRRFDLAADSAYLTSAIQSEPRDKDVYAVHEVRSPLGIAQDALGQPAEREFLSYTAAVSNPLSDDFGAVTPYDLVSGDLMAVMETEAADWLLAVEFEARRFPQALRLTENLARLAACQLLTMHGRRGPELLTYPPEYELPAGDTSACPVDPATADLAEQPGGECGLPSLPPGGYAPHCNLPAPAAARPYGARFSHCLAVTAADLTCACTSACFEAEPQAESQDVSDHSARPAAPDWSRPGSIEPPAGNGGGSRLVKKLRRHAFPANDALALPAADPAGWADSPPPVKPAPDAH